jgi:calpain-7
MPVYNPAGKYMVKLHLNGVARKVVVDDLLPVGRHNEPLCSYSSNRSELWISLLEKAYMKVMGGYDFPGSNSNIDLFALTGWIPERVAVRPDDPVFNADATFKQLVQRFSAGQVLVTAATGELSEVVADRAGLGDIAFLSSQGG